MVNKKIKILNGYCGIGGNRVYWDNIDGVDVEITAVELDPAIAEAYKSRFPNDEVIVGDVKEYLLKHYKEFNFIWMSPPCQTHSEIRRCGVKSGQYDAVMTDLSLYEIIIFLQTYAIGQWVVENVIPYYTPMIKPSVKIDRHLYWSNFNISAIEVGKDNIHNSTNARDLDKIIKDTSKIKNKIQVVRNQVNYETGKHILDCAMGTVQHKQGGLF